MKSKQLGLAGALLISALSSSAWADLVTNGNFSGCANQTCTGWTFTPAAEGTSFVYNDDNKGVNIAAGTGWAAFGAIFSTDDEISQVIPTVAGQTYTVSFQLGLVVPMGCMRMDGGSRGAKPLAFGARLARRSPLDSVQADL
jgi:hypothetical protein